jgi:hypothetical protein
MATCEPSANQILQGAMMHWWLPQIPMGEKILHFNLKQAGVVVIESRRKLSALKSESPSSSEQAH